MRGEAKEKTEIKIMSLFAPTFRNLEELYLNELRDLYSAETQLLDALPRMAEAATSMDLRAAFQSHLAETRTHALRLEEIFRNLGESPSGETCAAMKGLIKEGGEYVDASGDRDVRDAGLIGAAQRVEHYEMAAYGTARALAQRLGYSAAAQTLQQTLDEERAADMKLTEIALTEVNPSAQLASARM
jgi:ferritin-like metal-binding protein YciE